jgi:PAS domain S-box-containing protein
MHMEKPLRVLHLEDDPDFSALVSAMLEKEGLHAEMIQAVSFADYIAALEREAFDIILADYTLPNCNGMQALQAARRKRPDTPFLLLSGTIGEDAAIECLRCGATDYVLKSRLERLVPAVRRALQEARERAQRRQAEAELVRREKYFRTVTENSLDVVSILSRDGVFQYSSPSLKTVLGYEPKELAGRSAIDLIHPEDVAAVREVFKQALHNPELRVTSQFRIRHHDGSWRYLEVVGQNRLDDPEIAGMVVNSRDISDRKRAESEMRESERRIRDLFEGSPDAIFVEDLNANVLDVNPAACSLHGLAREQLIGKNASDLVPPGRWKLDAAHDFRKLVKGVAVRVEGESWTADGRAIPVEVHASRIYYGDTPALLLHVRDITGRKHAENAMRSSEMLFHSVWDNSVDGMRLTDEKGTIIAVNDAYCALVGMSRHNLEDKPFTVIYAASEDIEHILQTYRRRFEDRVIERQIERKITLHNGRTVILEDTSSFVGWRSQAPLLLGLFRDVTAQKRLEEQLRQSQKMEAIGQLAGGVAHDFNNILTVIHGHASLLLADKKLSKSAAMSGQQIVHAAGRAAGLTRQLLTFSRRQIMQPQRLDINEVVSNMTMMLGRILGEDIVLRLKYWPQPALVQADSSMIEQVLLNLVVNARDAMPKGGQLTIKISIVNINPNHLAYHHEAHAGQFVCLRVIDNGCGIVPENLRRIFEPFFTTKEIGKGTGLGLATVYGIVKQHQGWIEVESEPDKGAEFKVYLPATVETSKTAKNKRPEQTVRGGKETILVVEDEAPVRELLCSVLEGYGYQLLQAESGAKALEIWHQSKEKINLLLTDLVMPDRINGRELAEKMRAGQPRLKVIFTSGYNVDVVGKDFVLQDGLHYLQKPYNPQKLASTVRECLDA